ncbi:hypothetical protein [Stenotrophomonas sp. MMGLT7]|uniref:hypothetical protein n=1 Tax=Stenotrophomonas sp. MMGLT7 TaxID=2901227 RepID=UPI001E42E24E|nr:hypothetical protein [Stenotrophomonas sp. MMGLT7]MCD7097821.1 hypothetical protein [Stenotrophomonas sp. MMGLT7]
MLLSLLAVVPFAFCLYMVHLAVRRRHGNALQSSFAAHRFDTPDGPVGGASLRVVKASNQVSRHTSNVPAEVFWYCVGPGPSYFLAIAQVRMKGRRFEVDWTVRPLTEERMRAALAGDRKATALAFG